MEAEKTPQQQVKEAIWTYTGRVLVVLVSMGAGYYLGYLQWGDAGRLRLEVDRLDKQLSEFKNTRESLQTQIAMLSRDRDECRHDLSAARQAPPAAGVEAE